MMQEFTEEQPALFGYVMTMGESLGQDSRETALFISLVVWRAFQIATGQPVPTIEEDDLIACDDRNTEVLVGLDGKPDEEFLLTGLKEGSRQPWLMQYVVTSIMEPPETEDDPVIPEDETGMLYIILKTVIDALDNATDGVSENAP